MTSQRDFRTYLIIWHIMISKKRRCPKDNFWTPILKNINVHTNIHQPSRSSKKIDSAPMLYPRLFPCHSSQCCQHQCCKRSCCRCNGFRRNYSRDLRLLYLQRKHCGSRRPGRSYPEAYLNLQITWTLCYLALKNGLHYVPYYCVKWSSKSSILMGIFLITKARFSSLIVRPLRCPLWNLSILRRILLATVLQNCLSWTKFQVSRWTVFVFVFILSKYFGLSYCGPNLLFDRTRIDFPILPLNHSFSIYFKLIGYYYEGLFKFVLTERKCCEKYWHQSY